LSSEGSLTTRSSILTFVPLPSTFFIHSLDSPTHIIHSFIHSFVHSLNTSFVKMHKIVNKQNFERAKVVESLYPDLIETSDPFHRANFESLYKRKSKELEIIFETLYLMIVVEGKNAVADACRRRPLIFEEDAEFPKSTFKHDFVPKEIIPITNTGKDRDLKSNIYFDKQDDDDDDFRLKEAEQEVFVPVKLARPASI
jgi:hypothetical protein